jgi:hypothetical protein
MPRGAAFLWVLLSPLAFGCSGSPDTGAGSQDQSDKIGSRAFAITIDRDKIQHGTTSDDQFGIVTVTAKDASTISLEGGLSTISPLDKRFLATVDAHISEIFTTSFGIILYSYTAASGTATRLSCSGRAYLEDTLDVDPGAKTISDTKGTLSFADCGFDPGAGDLGFFVVPVSDWTGIAGFYDYTLSLY